MATAKKIPNLDYKVQLTLTPKEARLIMALAGRTQGEYAYNLDGIYASLAQLFPQMPYEKGRTFDIDILEQKLRDWVENGD